MYFDILQDRGEMYSDEEEDFTSPDEGSDSEPMLGKSTLFFSANPAS
jgi:hypothetical protein